MSYLALVVDDEHHQTTAQALRYLHWLAYALTNAHDALALMCHIKFDLVFTDWHMPVVSGYEMLEMMRDFGWTHYVGKVVVMSGDNNVVRAFRGHPFVYTTLVKPFGLDELGKILRDFAENSCHTSTGSI